MGKNKSKAKKISLKIANKPAKAKAYKKIKTVKRNLKRLNLHTKKQTEQLDEQMVSLQNKLKKTEDKRGKRQEVKNRDKKMDVDADAETAGSKLSKCNL